MYHMETTNIDEELAIMRIKIKLLMSFKIYLSNIQPINDIFLANIFALLKEKYNDTYNIDFVNKLYSNIFSNNTIIDEQRLCFISIFINQYENDKYDLLRDLLNAICFDYFY